MDEAQLVRHAADLLREHYNPDDNTATKLEALAIRIENGWIGKPSPLRGDRLGLRERP